MIKDGTVIKTGICSFGMSGKLFQAPFIEAHPGFELAAITERHNNDSREKYPKSRLFRSAEEMIADGSLELIIVNTPAFTHFDLVKNALNAGKNVIVEKPMVITVKEGTELKQI